MIKKIKPCKNEQELLNYAFFLLSRKDYSIAKMTEKLISRIDEGSDLSYSNIIDKLILNKYLDDKKLAEKIYLKYCKLEQGFKLTVRFKKEKIHKDIYEEILNKYVDDFTKDDALNLLIKKFKVYDKEKNDKYFRFLASKNIDFDLIKKSINLFKDK